MSVRFVDIFAVTPFFLTFSHFIATSTGERFQIARVRHMFFKLLDQPRILRRVYSQNIDALEILPRHDEGAHGGALETCQHSSSVKCEKYDFHWLRQQISPPETNDGVPKCDSSNRAFPPYVFLFGEQLPSQFWLWVNQDLRHECNAMLVLGTFLTVSPLSILVS